MNDDRLAAIEETLMRLEHELEQLDGAVRAQGAAHDDLHRRLDRLERRLTRLEPDEDESDDTTPV